MAAVVVIDALLHQRRVWKGQPVPAVALAAGYRRCFVGRCAADPRLVGSGGAKLLMRWPPRIGDDIERIESGWWDDSDICRDHRVARLNTGQRAGVYRDVGDGGRYWLNGWFA